MKNIEDVIRGKEQQLQQIQKELEALRLAAKLLAEDSDRAPAARPATAGNIPGPPMIMRPAQPGAAPQAVTAPKEAPSYVAPTAWDMTKPQFP